MNPKAVGAAILASVVLTGLTIVTRGVIGVTRGVPFGEAAVEALGTGFWVGAGSAAATLASFSLIDACPVR